MALPMVDVRGPVALAAVAGALVLSGCAGSGSDVVVDARPAAQENTDAPPDGWRWESYEDVRLAVPEDWGYGITGSSWCLPTSSEPFVGRPGTDLGNDCPEGQAPGEGGGLFSSARAQFVWFGVQEAAAEPVQIPKQLSDPVITGDRAGIQAGVVRVYVQAEEQTRRQILDSISFTDVDHNGCPADAPYAGDPDWRPSGPAFTELSDIRSATACKYSDARLRSSLRLDAEAAQQAVAAVAEAPEGGGPFNPVASCVPVEEESEAVEQLVIQVDAVPPATLGLRYGGCSSTGLDDGHTVRTLTRAAVQPFLQGSNQVTIQSWVLVSVLKQ